MKAKAIQVSALTDRIKNGFRGALVFGTDFGVIQEVTEQIAKSILPDYKTNFGVIPITMSQVKETPSILVDEANSPNLMGGRKLIWVKDGDNNLTDAVENFLEYNQTDCFLLITSGNLSKNSSLRTTCEGHQNMLAVVCYPDEIGDIMLTIRRFLTQKGITADEKVITMLSERLNENRLITRSELEKLTTYLGDGKILTPQDVLSVVTDTTNTSLDEFCQFVSLGQQAPADKAYHQLLSTGENPVSIVRILYQYFNRLLDGSVCYEQTHNMEEAVKKILRPAQFKLKTQTQHLLSFWTKKHILKVLNLLLTTEQQIKSTGTPSELLVGRTVIQITGVVKKIKK